MGCKAICASIHGARISWARRVKGPCDAWLANPEPQRLNHLIIEFFCLAEDNFNFIPSRPSKSKYLFLLPIMLIFDLLCIKYYETIFTILLRPKIFAHNFLGEHFCPYRATLSFFYASLHWNFNLACGPQAILLYIILHHVGIWYVFILTRARSRERARTPQSGWNEVIGLWL